MALQLSMAALLALFGWAGLTLSERPLPEDTSGFEALFDRNLWTAMALYAVSHLVLSAAIGIVAGLAVARLVLLGAAVEGRRRRQWLVLVPIAGALVSVGVGLAIA